MRRVKSQERRVESRTANVALRSGSGLWTLDSRLRSGLTLVELLITITIIAILAGMILGVASVAGETAREAHTRHMVTRLHTLLMQHLDTYKTRRVKVRPQILKGIDDSTDPKYDSAAEKGQARASARLYAMRELMMMEIPDRWSDIALAAADASPNPQILYPFFQDPTGTNNGRSELASAYLRRYLKAAATAPDTLTLTENQGAECLYLVITLACGDGEARTLFHESDIGDTDGDGALEFLDGWGRPIHFIRWAPGFDSEIQLNANRIDPPPPPSPSTVTNTWSAASDADHDPFDVFRVDRPAFRLVPLIYSLGRDETSGVNRGGNNYRVYDGLNQGQLAAVPAPGNWKAILPWAKVDLDPDTTGPLEYLGTVNTDGTASDNIHNHLLGERR